MAHTPYKYRAGIHSPFVQHAIAQPLRDEFAQI